MTKKRKSADTKPGRKPGAQPGNKNALRHGFYSAEFTKPELTSLDDTKPDDITAEIALIRVCINRLQKELDYDTKEYTDANGNKRTDTYLLQALNTLAIMTQSISTLARTHAIIHGKSGKVNDAIEDALNQIRLELGI